MPDIDLCRWLCTIIPPAILHSNCDPAGSHGFHIPPSLGHSGFTIPQPQGSMHPWALETAATMIPQAQGFCAMHGAPFWVGSPVSWWGFSPESGAVKLLRDSWKNKLALTWAGRQTPASWNYMRESSAEKVSRRAGSEPAMCGEGFVL